MLLTQSVQKKVLRLCARCSIIQEWLTGSVAALSSLTLCLCDDKPAYPQSHRFCLPRPCYRPEVPPECVLVLVQTLLVQLGCPLKTAHACCTVWWCGVWQHLGKHHAACQAGVLLTLTEPTKTLWPYALINLHLGFVRTVYV